MGYIYCITNLINNKKYVGKTIYSIDKRWRQHINDSKKNTCELRPLYKAMNKYGIDNFTIKELEQCDDQLLSIKEQYWIDKYNTYQNGYNATLGGDGKIYLDYNKIIQTYQEIQNISKVADIIGCSRDAVRNILHNNNIIIKSSQDIAKEQSSKQIGQYDKQGNLLNIYPSIKAAERAMGNTQRHIVDCVNGKRQTAYGFIWAEIE